MTSEFPSFDTPSLPPPPTKPAPEDCCGHDCAVCVFDLYDQELVIWEKECERVRRAARTHALSPASTRSSSPVLEPETYRDFVIVDVQCPSSDIVEILTRPAVASTQPLGIQLGQHLVIRCRDYIADGKSNQVSSFSRQLTPFDVNVLADETFKLMIKLKPNGRLAEFAKSWISGDTLSLRGPFGGLTYRRNQYDKIWMLCIGVGIAPLLSYVAAILDDESDETEISLHYGCRYYEDVCQKQKLDAWTSFWNFKATYYLSGETETSLNSKRRYGEAILRTRLDRNKVKDAVLGGSLRQNGANTAVLIVGSPSFELDSAEALKDGYRGKVFRFTNLSLIGN